MKIESINVGPAHSSALPMKWILEIKIKYIIGQFIIIIYIASLGSALECAF